MKKQMQAQNCETYLEKRIEYLEENNKNGKSIIYKYGI
tara:strand:+ start:437 stop:550 length:114 start_codon:yes stop_codon:yes gene_type:complete